MCQSGLGFWKHLRKSESARLPSTESGAGIWTARIEILAATHPHRKGVYPDLLLRSKVVIPHCHFNIEDHLINQRKKKRYIFSVDVSFCGE